MRPTEDVKHPPHRPAPRSQPAETALSVLGAGATVSDHHHDGDCTQRITARALKPTRIADAHPGVAEPGQRPGTCRHKVQRYLSPLDMHSPENGRVRTRARHMVRSDGLVVERAARTRRHSRRGCTTWRKKCKRPRREATTTGATGSGTKHNTNSGRAAAECALIVGGIPRDTPGKRIDKFVRRAVAQCEAVQRIFGSAGFSSPACSPAVSSPGLAFTLTSSSDLQTPSHDLPTATAGTCGAAYGLPFSLTSSSSGTRTQRWASVQTSKDERIKLRRRVALATLLGAGFQAADSERRLEPWRMICWRSRTMIFDLRRVVTL